MDPLFWMAIAALFVLFLITLPGINGGRFPASSTPPPKRPREKKMEEIKLSSEEYLYVVLLMDRHMDPQITLFDDPASAITYTSKVASENCRNPENLEVMCIDGYLSYIRYSIEGDYVVAYKLPVNRLYKS